MSGTERRRLAALRAHLRIRPRAQDAAAPAIPFTAAAVHEGLWMPPVVDVAPLLDPSRHPPEARRRALAWLEEQQELEGTGKKVEWRREVERMYAVYLPNTPLSPIRNGVLA